MTLNDIEVVRGSAQLKARYIHAGKWDYRLQLVFNNGRRFTCNTKYRSIALLRHDWLHNQYKFYKTTFNEV